MTIADAANRDGAHAHPGIDAMADGALYSRRQAIDLATELVAEGWAVVEHAGGGRGLATVYGLPMVQPPHCLADETVQPEPVNGAVPPPETVQPGAETVQLGLHPNGVATVEPNGKAQPPGPSFDAFYAAYPLHTGVGAARKAWPRAVAKADAATIVAGAQRYAADPNRVAEFTAHPATWLNAERWNDEPLPPRAQQRGARAPQRIDTDRSRPSGVVNL